MRNPCHMYPKSTKNASGSTRKPPRAPTKQPTQFDCNFLSLPGPSDTSVFTNFGSKIVEKWLQKISQKTDSPKTYCFSVFFFHFAKVSKKAPMWGLQNRSRESFFSVFLVKRQNVTKVYYIHTFVEVGRAQNGARIGRKIDLQARRSKKRPKNGIGPDLVASGPVFGRF